MGPRRDLHPQPMPSQGTALLLSYEDQNEEVRARTSEAETNPIHGLPFYGKSKTKKLPFFASYLLDSEKRTRVLKIDIPRSHLLFSAPY